MLSLNQFIEIRESILAYLKSTFTFQNQEVHNDFYYFITHPTDGLFKGPYLSLKLPFVKASEQDQKDIPSLGEKDTVHYLLKLSFYYQATSHETYKLYWET